VTAKLVLKNNLRLLSKKGNIVISAKGPNSFVINLKNQGSNNNNNKAQPRANKGTLFIKNDLSKGMKMLKKKRR